MIKICKCTPSWATVTPPEDTPEPLEPGQRISSATERRVQLLDESFIDARRNELRERLGPLRAYKSTSDSNFYPPVEFARDDTGDNSGSEGEEEKGFVVNGDRLIVDAPPVESNEPEFDDPDRIPGFTDKQWKEHKLEQRRRESDDPGENQRQLLDYEPLTPKTERQRIELIKSLPRWVDDDETPETTELDCCTNCGARGSWGEPLERGRVLDVEGDDGDPVYEQCTDVGDCDCCGCPDCHNLSIYYRESKEPDYKCRTPYCNAEFNHPLELPFEEDDVPRRLHWLCEECNGVLRAPFVGIPTDHL